MLAVAVALGFQLALPSRLTMGLGPRWLIPALEAALLLVLLAVNPGRITEEVAYARMFSLALIALISVANMVSLAELINALLYNSKAGGRPLIISSVPIWLTNIIVFSLWYWELDRGGPAARRSPSHRRPDFLFPQMSSPGAAPAWTPRYLDYLYTSFTNSTAFSPTDTMPLTDWAKMLFMVQAFVSLLTVALVVSRAVNILA